MTIGRISSQAGMTMLSKSVFYIILLAANVLYGAYTDIRYGRVNNVQLIIAGSIGLLAHCVYYLFGYEFLPNATYLINAGLAFLAVLVLYISDIWAPGDCKLFILLALLYPLDCYAVVDGNVFPSLNFIVYSFAFGFLFLVIRNLKNHQQPNTEQQSKTPISKDAVKRYIAFWGFSLLVSRLLNILIPVFYSENMAFCVLATIVFEMWISNQAEKVFSILGIIGLMVSMASFFYQGALMSSWISILISLGTACILIALKNRTISHTYQSIDIGKVQEGMILSWDSILAMKSSKAKDIPRFTTENRRSRISEEQATAINRWSSRTNVSIIVVKMIPFVPFLALAYLLQIVILLISRG